MDIPFPFSANNGHLNEVSPRISSKACCGIKALSARAIPSANPARVTALIECKIKFIFVAAPTSPSKKME